MVLEDDLMPTAIGVVEGGRVTLPEEVALPEGARVIVEWGEAGREPAQFLEREPLTEENTQHGQGERVQTSETTWDDARRRAREAIAADPEFAATCRRPVIKKVPRHEILDKLRAGEFRENGQD